MWDGTSIHYLTRGLALLLNWFSFPISIFSGVDGFSVDVTTMVDIRDQTNKELAMRLVTDIQSGDVFYSDLNGFQVGQARRERNKVNGCTQI